MADILDEVYDYVPNPFKVDAKPEESDRDILVRSIHNIMQTAEGRTVVWAFLGATEFFDDPLSNDPVDLARQQGKRQVGHWVIHLLEDADPTSFPRMQLEVAKKHKIAMSRKSKGVNNAT